MTETPKARAMRIANLAKIATQIDTNGEHHDPTAADYSRRILTGLTAPAPATAAPVAA